MSSRPLSLRRLFHRPSRFFASYVHACRLCISCVVFFMFVFMCVFLCVLCINFSSLFFSSCVSCPAESVDRKRVCLHRVPAALQDQAGEDGEVRLHAGNQQTNHPTNKLTNQPTNKLSNKLSNEPNKHTNLLTNQQANEPTKPTNQQTNKPTDQPANKTNKPINQPTD